MVMVYRKDFLQGYEINDTELADFQASGYTTSYEEAEAGSRTPGGQNYTGNVEDQSQDPNRTLDEGIQQANLLFQFMPESVRNEFAKQWIEYGDTKLAQAATRQTAAWDKEFGYLKRDDGSFIMSELEAVTAKAAYRETLGEIGIADTSEFENQFEALIKGEVSADEFQQRIDTVWGAVKNNIPQVEQLFRERYNINSDTPTIFAALINPTIQDKLLKGEIKGLGVAAEAKVAGFTNTFEHFDALAKAGLTQQGARELYGAASGIIGMGQQTGTAIGLEAIEQAAVGDEDAKKQLQLLGAESKSMSSFAAGPAKKDGKVSGLLET